MRDLELPALLDAALRGDRAALRALLGKLAPIIQARAVRVLARRGSGGREPRQELQDMVQEVFVSLLEHDGRALRGWREERGMSLENFVGLLAEQQVCRILRTGKRNPWKEDPVEDDALQAHVGAEDESESLAISRDLLTALLDRLREELSPRMLELFYALWVEETPVATICERTGMQAEAVYTARSRITKRAREILAELTPSMSGRAGVAS